MRDLPFRFALRKLLAAVARRERNYLYAVLAGSPAGDLEELASRLADTLAELAGELGKIAGDTVRPQLPALLGEHAAITVKVMAFLKAGDQVALNRETSRWYSNVNNLATALASGGKWAKPDVAGYWQKHVKLTLEEAGAAAKKDWIGFAEAYRRAFQNFIKFADYVSAIASR